MYHLHRQCQLSKDQYCKEKENETYCAATSATPKYKVIESLTCTLILFDGDAFRQNVEGIIESLMGPELLLMVLKSLVCP